MSETYLIGLRDEYQKEVEELQARLARTQKALEGIQVAIELEREKAGRNKPVSRLKAVNLATLDDSQEPESPITEEDEGVMDLIIEEAVSQTGPVRAPEFSDYLTAKYPGRSFNKSTVSHALRRAEKLGKMRMVQKGQGKRPSVFISSQLALS